MFIDILCVLILGYGFYVGYTKGFVMAIFSAIAWMVGLLAALKLTDIGSGLIRDWTDSKSPYIPVFTFIFIFIGVTILVILFGRLIDNIITVAQLGIFNKIAGGIMKATLFLLLFSVLLWILNQASVLTPEVKAKSYLYPYSSPIAPKFFSWLDNNLPALSGLLNNLKKYFNDMSIHHIEEMIKK